MATKAADPDVPTTPSNDDEGWETVNVGLGTEHNVEEKGPFTGTFVETQIIPVEDKNNPGTMRDTAAHIFLDAEGSRRFIWGSYNLDEAMKEFGSGDQARIKFDGRETFTGDRGPQTIKNYTIQRKPAH